MTNVPSLADKFVSGVAKTTGFTRDFTGDVLGAAGSGAATVAALSWMSGNTALLLNPFFWIITSGGAIVTAMTWKRFRRDNQ